MKTIITSGDRAFIDLRELRQFSGLLRYLSLRDVFVRYKQTLVGFGWSIFRPLINILIFGSFSYLLDRSGDFRQRFLFVAAGIVFWQLISTAITEVSNSLTANSNILTKVYFPKVILPVSSILVCLVDFAIAFALFLIFYFVLGATPSWQFLLLPLVIVFAMLFAFGFGLIAATASVRYRDVKFILPFLLQILFYVSPVFISSQFILSHNLPRWMEVAYQLNPLVFIMNSFKYCVFGTFENLDPLYAASSVGITLLLVYLSVRYFMNFEKTFADYI